MRRPVLIRPSAAHHRRYGARQDAKIETERPVLDVVAVEAHDFLEVDDVASTAHLPEAGEAGLHGKPAKMMRLVIGEVGLEEWSGADERHVSHQHVVELRKLVEAPPANDSAESRDAWIGRNLE